MIRIKGTTLCEKKREHKNGKTSNKKIKNQKIKNEKRKKTTKKTSTPTPTYGKTLEELMTTYINQKIDTVIPYDCFQSSNIMMFIHLIENNKNACIYNILRYGILKVVDNTLSFNSKTHRNNFIESIRNQYALCKKNKKILCIPMQLLFKGDGGGYHLNMIIMNPFRNEVERFEPHGTDTLVDGYKPVPLNRELKSLVYDIDLMMDFIPSHKICPRGYRGYQEYDCDSDRQTGEVSNVKIRDPVGFCCAWSYFYADLRLKYPRLPGSEIFQRSIKTIGDDPEQFRMFIRGQVAFLMEMFKKSKIKMAYAEYVKRKRRKKGDDIEIVKKPDKEWSEYVWKYFGQMVLKHKQKAGI